MHFGIFTLDPSISLSMIQVELHNRAKLAILGLWLSFGVQLALVFQAAYGIHLFDQMIAGREYDDSTLLFFDDLTGMLAIGTLAVMVFTATGFIRWMNTAFDILVDRGMIMPFEKQYVSWAFFIPFVNLVRPYQAIVSIFDGALQMAGISESRERSFILPWWLLYILAGIIGNIAFRLTGNAETLEELRRLYYWDLTTSLMFVASAWLIIQVVDGYGKVVDQAIENDRIDMIGQETEDRF